MFLFGRRPYRKKESYNGNVYDEILLITIKPQVNLPIKNVEKSYLFIDKLFFIL